MFRPMRRKKQSLEKDACLDILHRGSSGVLALSAGNDYPYAVPISYLYHDNCIYFHSAKQGHKIDLLTAQPKASFCVIDQDDVKPLEYTSYFRSVIVFGSVTRIENPIEKNKITDLLAKKYAPLSTAEHRENAIRKEAPALCILALSIDHISGKEAIELVQKRISIIK